MKKRIAFYGVYLVLWICLAGAIEPLSLKRYCAAMAVVIFLGAWEKFRP